METHLPVSLPAAALNLTGEDLSPECTGVTECSITVPVGAAGRGALRTGPAHSPAVCLSVLWKGHENLRQSSLKGGGGGCR